jgi:hypothetical protein
MGWLGSSVDEQRLRWRQRYAAQRLPQSTQVVVETIPQAPLSTVVGKRLSPPQVGESRLACNVPETFTSNSVNLINHSFVTMSSHAHPPTSVTVPSQSPPHSPASSSSSESTNDWWPQQVNGCL